MHGGPAVVRAGGDDVGVDLSAYGFSICAAGTLRRRWHAHAELDEISSKLAELADAVGCSFTAVSKNHEDAMREPSALTHSAQGAGGEGLWGAGVAEGFRSVP
ncbi:hypothetical protein CYMTET_41867 [Cymbomonas tetramitiformis]|uniref:Uncharacterized protein n=1 Tax=Cymbomonas tetramitiformis TaxID=36881 RepID=A0AAE0C6K3_9CHLO|nr:hypothetical protein CYMTET_41867 [Cymbomonas tetramitiformis]